uniref:Ubiquitin-like protease family profile domain-containing protein n=1 Tax=Leersia perrieri TaxID=77586 RepID=A0A0D9V5E7_9ORYZ
MAAKSQPPELVELVGSSSPAVTPPPPTAARAWDYGDSDGDAEGAFQLAELSDQGLQESIRRWCGNLALTRRLRDGGEKMRRRIRRMEEELDRRRAAGPRKVCSVLFCIQLKDVMTWRPAVQPPSWDDSYAFKDGGKLSWVNVSSEYHPNVPTTATNNHGQVEEPAFSEELSYFGRQKNACLKKDRENASTPVSHQPTKHEVCPKSADDKQLNMDNSITYNKKKLGLKSCLRKRQKNNSFDDSNGVYAKLHRKDDTLTKRWEHSKSSITESGGLFNFKARNEQKDVILLDDEVTEPAESVNIEMTHKGDDPKIYYPSRTDMETVELTYSDIKCLEPEEYLKSPVINFYMQYLRKSRTRGDLYMFNTYFYSKLEEALSRVGDHDDSQFSKLRRWWKSVDIFQQPYIILPIHGKMHWSLIIICMPAKDTECGPMILHLDSLGLHSSQEVFDVIERYTITLDTLQEKKSYLKAEWQHLQNDSSYIIPFPGRIWSHLSENIYKAKVEVPSQPNEYDCGIFMLHYIERFIHEAPERLTKKNLEGLTRKNFRMFGHKWFDPRETSGLRDRIRTLVFDAFESARMDDELSQSEPHSDDHTGDEDKDGDTVLLVID